MFIRDEIQKFLTNLNLKQFSRTKTRISCNVVVSGVSENFDSARMFENVEPGSGMAKL